MADVSNCRVCNKKLVGDVGNLLITVGNFVYLVTRDSFDCNWSRCKGCKSVLCKSCYSEQHEYCCDEDRIVCRERAQAIADLEFQQIPQDIMPPKTTRESGSAGKNKNTNQQEEEEMSDFKIVYLIVERGIEPNRQVFWRSAGSAFICRDGSLNVRLDIHPGLTFNIRDPKSNGEREEAENFQNVTNGDGSGNGHAQAAEPGTSGSRRTQSKKPPKPDDDIPF